MDLGVIFYSGFVALPTANAGIRWEFLSFLCIEIGKYSSLALVLILCMAQLKEILIFVNDMSDKQ
jgi:hypothetical protein